MSCLVYGLANAATYGWHTPLTWGFLVAGVVGLAAFAAGSAREDLVLSLRVVLDRNRGVPTWRCCSPSPAMSGFRFVTYYLRTTLGYWPIVTGLASFLWLPR